MDAWRRRVCRPNATTRQRGGNAVPRPRIYTRIFQFFAFLARLDVRLDTSEPTLDTPETWSEIGHVTSSKTLFFWSLGVCRADPYVARRRRANLESPPQPHAQIGETLIKTHRSAVRECYTDWLMLLLLLNQKYSSIFAEISICSKGSWCGFLKFWIIFLLNHTRTTPILF